MKIRYPYYYKQFRCTAGECTDSCCMHWEIDIDEASAEKYEGWPGSFGDRIRNSMYRDDSGSHFRMDEKERCVFLNDKGLCDMILNIGEEHLCEICTEHPRYYDEFSAGEECGVGLCCEAAAALILDCSISDKLTGWSDEDIEDEMEADMFAERAYLLDHPEEFEALWDKDAAEGFCSDWAEAFYTAAAIKELISLLESLEISSEKWKDMLADLNGNIQEVLDLKNEFLYSHSWVSDNLRRLMNYFIYRYFMMARYDSDIELGIMEKVRFSMISVGMIILMDVMTWKKQGSFTLKDQINICKLYSQEIEYDEDNVLALESFWF